MPSHTCCDKSSLSSSPSDSSSRCHESFTANQLGTSVNCVTRAPSTVFFVAVMVQTPVPVASPSCVAHLTPQPLTHGEMCFVSEVQVPSRVARLQDLAHFNANLLDNKAVTSSTATSAVGAPLREFVHFDIIKSGVWWVVGEWFFQQSLVIVKCFSRTTTFPPQSRSS